MYRRDYQTRRILERAGVRHHVAIEEARGLGIHRLNQGYMEILRLVEMSY